MRLTTLFENTQIVNPQTIEIMYVEPHLKADQLKEKYPFNPTIKSNQPIRAVLHDNKLYVIQGNHRAWSAKQQGLTKLPMEILTPEEYNATSKVVGFVPEMFTPEPQLPKGKGWWLKKRTVS